MKEEFKALISLMMVLAFLKLTSMMITYAACLKEKGMKYIRLGALDIKARLWTLCQEQQI